MKNSTIGHSQNARRQRVDQQLTQLPTLSRSATQKLWRGFFGWAPGPALRRNTLIPILAYRIHEDAYGGLKESTSRKLRELADERAIRGSRAQNAIHPKPGTHYVREYNGKLHEVTALESGFEYGGKTYRSLTEIAKVITGTKWSGPAFFGYKHPTRRTAA